MPPFRATSWLIICHKIPTWLLFAFTLRVLGGFMLAIYGFSDQFKRNEERFIVASECATATSNSGEFVIDVNK